MLVAGPPRSGTTLVCELLNRLPDVRALDEPMSPSGLLGERSGFQWMSHAGELAGQITRFASDQRESLLSRGTATSKHVAGQVLGAKVSDDHDAQGLRRRLATKGAVSLGVPDDEDFILAIKHPVAFTALLAVMSEYFRMVAIVRNPLATLASWESVPMPVRDGRLGMPPTFLPQVDGRLDAIADRIDRQVELLEWFFEQIATHLDDSAVIRYEDVVNSGGGALARLAPSAARLRVALTITNTARLTRTHLSDLARRLLARDGAYRRYYSRSDIEAMIG